MIPLSRIGTLSTLISALALSGCASDLPPAQEADVVRFLVDDFLARLPIDEMIVVSRVGDCGTDRTTGSAVPASLFAAFLTANSGDFAPLDLAAYSPPPHLRVDASGTPPRTLNRRERKLVVALSRAGIDGNKALVCVEVFSVFKDRGFFHLLHRDHAGKWSLHSELLTW